MPGKSRRGHGKQSARGKKRRHVVTSVAPPPVTPREYRPPDAPAPPSAIKSASPETTTGIRYPNIVMELRRIGILAGVILAILIILALVLPYISV